MHNVSTNENIPIQARTVLDQITPYKGGMTLEDAARKYSRSDFAKLASNENLHGASPAVVAAIQEASGAVVLYPDPYCERLRTALSERIGVSSDRICVGPGSEAIIDYLFRALIRPNEEILISSPTFPAYRIFGLGSDATIVDIPRLANFDLDVPAIVNAIAHRAPRLLILCNPNNPTGNPISRPDFEDILGSTPISTTILLDEAYLEYDQPINSIDLLDRWGGHYLIARTFSKAFALAGLRVGYAIASCPSLIDYIDRVRPHFNVSGISQAAALAAWNDAGHMERTVATTINERERVSAALAGAGFEISPSSANFLFVHVHDALDSIMDRLLGAGVIVRPIPVGDRNYLRITIGRPEDNDRLIANIDSMVHA